MWKRYFFIFVLALFAYSVPSFGQTRRKIIVDQDARGPATTDQQSILMLLQSPQVETLGITVVSGDQWRDEEVAHTLRMLELTKHTNTKVYPGAVFPLINSKEEIARWSKLYGRVVYQGAWNENGTTSKTRFKYHDPYVIPEMIEGAPTLKAEDEDAAHFIIRMLHKYPHEITIYAGGPLTNIAQVISLDPQAAELAQELIIMGGSILPLSPPSYKLANRREFNFWFDPEAVHITLRAPWKKVTVTTVDISVKTRMTKALIEQIGKAGTPTSEYIHKFSDEEYLWDELAVGAWLDPSIITQEEQLFMDIDISHTAGYGNTLVWNKGDEPGMGERLVHVQNEVDLDKFYKMIVDLLSRPSPAAN